MTLHFSGEEDHEAQSNGTAVWVDGERSVASAEDAGGFAMQFAERWRGGFRSMDEALAAIAEVQEQLLLQNGSEGHAAAVVAQRFYRNLMLAVKAYKGPRAFALDCACLALGWTDILGLKTQQELADKWRCEKANVNKCMKHIQDMCGIPPTAEQRDDMA